MGVPEATLQSTRRSLITRLKNWDDQEGWQRFFDTYWRLLFTVAIRMGLNDCDAEDAVQESVMMVAEQMPGFKYDPERGSFKSWLMLIARRRVIAHLRKKRREPMPAVREAASSTRTDLIQRIPDTESVKLDEVWQEEWERHLFDLALERIKRSTDPRHFQLFDCYVLKGWKVEDIARNLKVSTAQIYTVKHRITSLIKEEIQRLEKEML